MEFPDLGTHCSLPDCRQLDFLPFKCEACGKTFCKEHFSYTKHNCSQVKDRVVPTCPVCGRAVGMIDRQEDVDAVVNRHIENECELGKKSTKTKCEVKGCKEKEFVKVECAMCHRNFCLRHRHASDHQCSDFINSPNYISKPGSAALARANNFLKKSPSMFKQKLIDTHEKWTSSRPQQPTTTQQTSPQQRPTTQQQPQRITALQVNSLQQSGLSEEEAMRRALEESIQQPQQQQELENDESIARALQESEYLARNAPVPASHSKQSCCIS